VLESLAGSAGGSLISGLSRKVVVEQLFGFLQPSIGEHNGLGLVSRITDQALPGPALIVQRQPHQRENRLVDLALIDLRDGSIPRNRPGFSSLRRMLTGEQTALTASRSWAMTASGTAAFLA
jgi:hypothetical protein